MLLPNEDLSLPSGSSANSSNAQSKACSWTPKHLLFLVLTHPLTYPLDSPSTERGLGTLFEQPRLHFLKWPQDTHHDTEHSIRAHHFTIQTKSRISCRKICKGRRETVSKRVGKVVQFPLAHWDVQRAAPKMRIYQQSRKRTFRNVYPYLVSTLEFKVRLQVWFTPKRMTVLHSNGERSFQNFKNLFWYFAGAILLIIIESLNSLVSRLVLYLQLYFLVSKNLFFPIKNISAYPKIVIFKISTFSILKWELTFVLKYYNHHFLHNGHFLLLI